MRKGSTAYTFVFATAICVACSLVVSTAAKVLAERQATNVKLDKQRNILHCVGLGDAEASPEEVRRVFSERMSAFVVDAGGRIIPGKSPKDLNPDSFLEPETFLDPSKSPTEFPLYVRTNEDGVAAYAFPIAGKGLWSSLYGFLAIEPDAKTVKGITFFKHGETPGLGAEIQADWFMANWPGKTIVDRNGRPAPVRVVKGKSTDACAGASLAHCVDGISGATMTSKGVTDLVAAALKRYEPLLARVRKGDRVVP